MPASKSGTGRLTAAKSLEFLTVPGVCSQTCGKGDERSNRNTSEQVQFDCAGPSRYSLYFDVKIASPAIVGTRT